MNKPKASKPSSTWCLKVWSSTLFIVVINCFRIYKMVIIMITWIGCKLPIYSKLIWIMLICGFRPSVFWCKQKNVCFNWSFTYHCMCSSMLPLVSPFTSGTQVLYMQVSCQNHLFQFPFLYRFRVDHKHSMNNYKHKYCSNPCHSINHLIFCWKIPHGLWICN